MADQKEDTTSFSDQSSLQDTIQSPELDPDSLKAERRAIKDAKQAWNIYSKLVSDNRDRVRTNAEIANRYKGQQPFDKVEAWQANFPTLTLAGLVDKVVPALSGYVENAKVLTQSKLRADDPDSMRKSERAREIFTKYVRRWPGWRSFTSSLSQEDTLMGYGLAARTDEYEWRPKFYRQDEAFVPEGTPQFSDQVQVLAIKQDMLIHEATDIIKKREAAKAAGWNIDNMVEAINKARPIGEDTNTEDNERKWVDAVREGNLGVSFSSGAKVVKMAHVLAVETDTGKVTHWIVDRERENNELFKKEDRFNSMRDIVALFTLEPGNSKFYGSKGLGRMLVNPCVAMDVVVNGLVDQLRLAGMIPILVDHSKGAVPAKLKPPFIEISAEGKPFDTMANFPGNVTAGIALINELRNIIETATQQFVPNTLSDDSQGEKPTARQVSIDYKRELESRSSYIARFAGHLGEMIGMMQRAMFNPKTNDDEAKLARKEILGDEKENLPPIMTEEELKEWAESPASEVLQDLTMQENNAVIAAANDPELIQSPMIDQKVRTQAKVEAMIGVAKAQAWVRPDSINPDDEKEQFRLQSMESENIMSGAKGMVVADRDNDKVHLDLLVPDLMKSIRGIAQQFNQNPVGVAHDPKLGEMLDHISTGLMHAVAHIQKWQKQGAPPQVVKPYEYAVQQIDGMIKDITQAALKVKQGHAQAQQQAQLQQVAQQPQGANGATPTPPPESPPGGQFTEKVEVAWIAQFDKLPDEARTVLMIKSGLLTPAEKQAIDAATSGEAGAGSLPQNGSAPEVLNSATPPTPVQPGAPTPIPPPAAVPPSAAPERAPALPTAPTQ
jgi:hypothetical protein